MVSFNSSLSSVKRQKCEVKPSKTIFDSGNIWSIVFSFLSISNALECKKVCKSWKFHVIPQKLFSNSEVRVQELATYWCECDSNDFSDAPEDWKDLFLKNAANIFKLRLGQNQQFQTIILSKVLKVSDLTLHTISNKELELVSHLPLTSLSFIQLEWYKTRFTSKTLQSFWNCKTLQNLSLPFHNDLFSFDGSEEIFPNLRSLKIKCHNHNFNAHSNIKNLGNFRSITSLNYSTSINTTVLTNEIISNFTLLKNATIKFYNLFRNYPKDLIGLSSSLSLETLHIKQSTNLDNNAGIELLNQLSLGILKSINYTFNSTNKSYYCETEAHKIFNSDKVAVTLEYYNFSKILDRIKSEIKNLHLVFHISQKIEEDSDEDDEHAIVYDGSDNESAELESIDDLEEIELKSIKLIFESELTPGSVEEKHSIYLLNKHSDLIHSIQTTNRFMLTPNILTQLRKKPLKNCSHLEGPFCKKRSHLFHSISTNELRIYFPNFKQLIRPVFYDKFEFC